MALDPQCAALVEAALRAGRSPFEQDDAVAARKAYAGTTAFYSHPTPDLERIEDRMFSGPGGPVPVRIYRPRLATPVAQSPVLVFFHGGGWVVGDLDTHDHLCRYLADAAGVAVISIDYRLAPERKFPAGLDDCTAAVRWVGQAAAHLHVDPARIAVGGDSAGGNLAAATAMALRDKGGPRPRLQLLIYPALDFTADNASLRDNGEGYLLTRGALDMFMDWYLPGRALRTNPRASPQLARRHTDLPPAFIQTAEFDPLRDEGQRYAATLAAAGVEVRYKCYPGMVHGFARMGAKVDMAFTALDDAAHALREAFAGPD